MGEALRITIYPITPSSTMGELPEEFARLGALAQRNADQRYALYQQLAARKAPAPAATPEPVVA